MAVSSKKVTQLNSLRWPVLGLGGVMLFCNLMGGADGSSAIFESRDPAIG